MKFSVPLKIKMLIIHEELQYIPFVQLLNESVHFYISGHQTLNKMVHLASYDDKIKRYYFISTTMKHIKSHKILNRSYCPRPDPNI